MFKVYEIKFAGIKGVYVGATAWPEDRKKAHLSKLNNLHRQCKGAKHSIYWHRQLNLIPSNWYKKVAVLMVKRNIKKASDIFKFKIIMEFDTIEDAALHEHLLIKMYWDKKISFNRWCSPSYSVVDCIKNKNITTKKV